MKFSKMILIGVSLLFFSCMAIANECQLYKPDITIDFQDDLPKISFEGSASTHIEFADMKMQLTKGKLSDEDSLMFLSVLSEYYLADFESTSLTFYGKSQHSRNVKIFVDPYFKSLLKNKDCANSVISALSKSPFFASS